MTRARFGVRVRAQAAARPRRARFAMAWFGAAAMLATLACAGPEGWRLPGRLAVDAPSRALAADCVVARVGGQPILRRDVRRARAALRLSQLPASGEGLQRPAGPDDAAELGPVPLPAEELAVRKVVLAALIDEALLLQAAERAHVTALADEVEAAWAQLIAGWPDAALAQALRSMDVTVAELKARLRTALVASKVLHSEATDRVAVQDGEVEAYLQAHPEACAAPEQLHLRQIVVQREEDVVAVQEAIKRKASFADVAARLSTAPEAQGGGDLGIVGRDALPKAMAEVCFALKARQLSKPVQAADGWHLFWVGERLPARVRSYSEMRPTIERQLRVQREAQAAKDYLTQLQEKAHVQTFEDNLADAAP